MAAGHPVDRDEDAARAQLSGAVELYTAMGSAAAETVRLRLDRLGP